MFSGYIQKLKEIKGEPTQNQITSEFITFIKDFLTNDMHNHVNNNDIYLMFNEFISILEHLESQNGQIQSDQSNTKMKEALDEKEQQINFLKMVIKILS